MSFNDEIDYAEHAAVKAQVADERRNECGRRITLVVEWERTEFSDDRFAVDLARLLRDTATFIASHQTNPNVSIQNERLGE